MRQPGNPKARAAALSALSSIALLLMKLLVGLLIGSVAVMAKAIDSGLDLIAASIAFLAVRAAAAPADHNHHYGHGKYENLSGVIEALMIFGAAGWIIYEAVWRIIEPRPMEDPGWGIAVMVVSAVVNLGISTHLFRVARRTDSMALYADAVNRKTDIYTSVGVMVGLGVVWAGARLLPGANLVYVDPVIAIAVAGLILWNAGKLTVTSARDLLDMSLPPEELEWIRAYVAGLGEPVRGMSELLTRKSGPTRIITLHLAIDSTLSVAEAHAVSDRIEHEMSDHLDGAHVTIHVEPG